MPASRWAGWAQPPQEHQGGARHGRPQHRRRADWLSPDLGCGPAGRWPKNTIDSHSAECRRVGTQEIACSGHSPAQRVSGFGSFGGGKTIAEGEDHRPGYEQVERWECVPACPVGAIEAQRGDLPSRFFQTFASHETGGAGASGGAAHERLIRHEEAGFLLAAKPSKAETEAGLTGGEFEARRGHRLAYGKREDVATYRLNTHPTVKPMSVMRWLIDLACPGRGRGGPRPLQRLGSTGCAAVLAGRKYVGIELDKDDEGYLDITAARISYWAEKAKEERAGAGKVVRLPSPSERARVKKAVVKKAVVKKAA